MNIKELRAHLTKWQHRLNLADWKISIKWGAAGHQGWCSWHPEEQYASIEINRTCGDPVSTLVHELLHIVIEGHQPETREYSVPLERAINKISAALLIHGDQ